MITNLRLGYFGALKKIKEFSAYLKNIFSVLDLFEETNFI